jgi:hypothetical protein
MDTSRRRFFGLGTAALAVAAVPVAAVEISKPSDDAVGPILLEHVCDAGSSRYTTKEIAEMKKDWPERYLGCGTKFRWYFGMMPICPNCGFHYQLTLEDIKTGFYKRISG